MNPISDFNRQLTAWLDAEAPSQAPASILQEALDRAADVTQRPVWLLPERWIPMQATMRLATVSRGAIYAMLIIILAVLLAVAVFVVGQQHRPAPVLGIAANGLIADDPHGQITLVSPTGTVVRTLTTSSEIAIRPAFSPDGLKIAFWSISRPADVSLSARFDEIYGRIVDTPASIVVLDLATDVRTTVATNVKFGDAPLAWSHKGDAIAYGTSIAQGFNVVFVVSSTGSQRARIDLAVDPSWSPDDSEIAIGKFDNGVFVINRDGSDPRKVSQAYGIGGSFTRPEWSPDGTQIAYVGGDDPGYRVYVANADGSNERLVADVMDGRQATTPRFSPDGTKLAFQRRATDNPEAVNWIVADADGANAKALPTDLWWAPGGWSPDGRYLIGYDGESEAPNIVLVNASSGSTTRIPTSGSIEISWQRLAP
jgi:Tol biopolymer transport system component